MTNVQFKRSAFILSRSQHDAIKFGTQMPILCNLWHH